MKAPTKSSLNDLIQYPFYPVASRQELQNIPGSDIFKLDNLNLLRSHRDN